MYYNTASETGQKLANAKASAATQDKRILDLFRKMPNSDLHAWTVKTFLHGDVPITSVRRAITNLADAGRIERVGSTYAGPYRRKTYTYRFVN